MKKIILSLVAIILMAEISNAQIIDVLQVHIGTAIFPSTESLNFQSGKPENIYGAYAPAQILGFGASKFLTDKIQLNAVAEVMNTFKPNYNLISQKTALNVKYNVIAPDIYRLSPYVIGGGSVNFIYLSQSGFTREYETPNDYDGVRNVDINRITYNEDSYRFFSPAAGANIGVGLDVNVFEVVSVFGEFSYNYIFTTRSGLQTEYNKYNAGFENKADFTFTSLNFGVRLYMY
ncbi:MAG: hypothetical protein ACKVOU_02060 [Cytophagales bacterium]